MNEVTMTTEAFSYRHNWRGIDDITLCDVEGTLLLKIARRWIDISRIISMDNDKEIIQLN